MPGFPSDLAAAVKALRGAAWTTVAAVLTMALGTGANVAVLAVAYGALWRPLPMADADRLVAIDLGDPGDARPGDTVRRDELDQWRERFRAIEGVAGWSPAEFTVRGLDVPEVVQAAVVTPDFFDVVGATPREGRVFTAGGDRGLAVLGAEFAARTRRRGVDPFGRPLTIGASTLQAAGILPAAFALPNQAELWVREDAVEAVRLGNAADFRSFRMVGRLAPGATPAQAQEDASRVLREVNEVRGITGGERRVVVRPLRDLLVGEARPVLLAFIGAAVLLLLVACANVATLLVSRSVRRQREFAVRLALGASPARLVRVALVESLIIASAGAVLGLLLARLGGGLLLPLTSDELPRVALASLDLPALLAGAALATLTTVLAGAAPAVAAARADFGAAFRTATIAGSRGGRRVRQALVVVQLAMAVVLLVGAGLFARSVTSLLSTDLGIDPGDALTFRLHLTETTRFDATSQGPFIEELLRRVRALPGVEAAGVGSNLPPGTAQLRMMIRVVNGEDSQTKTFEFGSASPGYFEAIGARLVRGRLFEPSDVGGPPVAVLSESAERHTASLGDPVGRELFYPLPRATGDRVKPRVVGIIQDVRYAGLETPANGSIYVLWSELPTGLTYLTVRGRTPAATLAPAVLRTMRDLDPTLPLPEVRTLSQEVHRTILGREMRLALVGAFAVLACLLSLAGLSGVLGRSVTERRREIAIRAVLGATPIRAVALVLRDALLLTLVGVVAGLGLAVATGRSLASLLYGVTPTDPLTFGVVAGGLALLALAAVVVPAARASRVRPAELLRSE
ncbi:MAG: ADOP family duplicated permease [Vicinamibacterales bacterium]